MLIGLDIDGTTGGYLEHIKVLRSQHFGPDYGDPDPADPDDYGIQFDKNWFTHPDHFKELHHLWEKTHLPRMPLLEGTKTKEAIQELWDDGHDILFVTSRSAYTTDPDRLMKIEKGTREWIKKHWGTDFSVVFTRHKTILPIDVLVDDDPMYFDPDLEVTQGLRRVLMSASYNQHVEGFDRISSLTELPALLR